MTDFEWMPWQSKEIDTATSQTHWLSTPRQNGKTEIAVEVAQCAARRGERVRHFSPTLHTAREAMRRTLSAMDRDGFSGITRTLRGADHLLIEVEGGGWIDFPSYRSGRRKTCDRMIFDDYRNQPAWRALLDIEGGGPALYCGLQLRPSADASLTYFGARPGDDLDAESTWRSVNPGVGVTLSPNQFGRLKAVMPDDMFHVEMLNLAEAA
ncbi:hypothetical protein [Rhodococcus sp. 3-2]|uniref:hypothetical protein n=1 Tax=Rhodococcus sp. 3-2 TaxID=2890836 RepID=UPI001D183F01|nr:hypothetical protein [Rhodococcus sp. 3-2]MCC4300398.1 hypothetical protein [Rhodococcus sp. 3-2]MCC4300458.1 hypothetical protein [Rhodococcus sp. 3-2]